MNTKIIKADILHVKEDYIREAAHILREGGLVIIPTETVYGLAADALKPQAVQKLYEIKRRSPEKPFSIVIDKKERVEEFARSVPVSAYKLIDKFWPGPLTLILKGIKEPTVGLRMPNNEIALRIIAGTQDPVFLPSANLSGTAAPVNFADALRDLDGLVDLAIDAGPASIGLESSIVDLTSDAANFLRIGAISKEDLTRVINKKNVVFVCTGNSCRSVMAEALFKKMMHDKHRDDVEVSSAGIMMLSGLSVSQGTKEVLARVGIDVSGHLSQRITREMVHKSDLILVMEHVHEDAILRMAPEVKNRVFLLKEFAKIDDGKLDIADPIGKSIEFYEDTFASIREALERVSNLI